MLILLWKKVLHMPAGRKAKLFKVILVGEGHYNKIFLILTQERNTLFAKRERSKMCVE
jgi:hypothetical protein